MLLTPLTLIDVYYAGVPEFGLPAVGVVRCWSGSYMTSLDMNGVSITIIRLSDQSSTSHTVCMYVHPFELLRQ